ncbi:killer cell lectin-like receptor subfamily F member 1 [Pelodiscus sinensis]|uniref:killer cell lectin-like receptor subfamily F member 1 n=1 Tax=Pelodiscus sinensis TaxID=13735 RepID=UPI003F6D15CA
MEDEEGYMALKPRPKQRQPGCRPTALGAQGSPRYQRWIWVTLGLAGAGCLVLLVAVITLAVRVSQLQVSGDKQSREAWNTSENRETRIKSTKCSFYLEDFQSHLKSILCEPRHGSLAGGAGCKLCPTDWLLRGDKCYWLSEERKDWAWSQKDCLGKSSRLLVLQSQEEMDSVQNVTQGENFIWIGLKAIPHGGKWTWVDGSPLDPARFSVLGPADGNSCGWIKGSRIHSETCGAELKWICQKDAAVI